MNNLLASFIKFYKNEDGLTVVEYVIGAGMLVGAVAFVYATMGNSLSTKFGDILNNVRSS